MIDCPVLSPNPTPERAYDRCRECFERLPTDVMHEYVAVNGDVSYYCESCVPRCKKIVGPWALPQVRCNEPSHELEGCECLEHSIAARREELDYAQEDGDVAEAERIDLYLNQLLACQREEMAVAA